MVRSNRVQSDTMKISPWWIDYRRQQYKPRPTMSIKMILRKSFIQIVKEYASNCSVAGVNHIANPDLGWKIRCIWTMIFFMFFALVCYFLIFTWLTTMANPLILMPQYSTFSIANIDYPAIAICNVNRISMKAVKRQALYFYENKLLGNVSLEHLEEFLVNTGRLIDFSYLETWGPPYSEIELFSQNIHNFDPEKIKNSMKQLAPDCKEMLLRCSWAGESVDCMSLFKMRRTARGHCCAFNYVLDFDVDGHPNKTIKARRQILPGFIHGLNVILDPMLDDYAYPLNVVDGFDVLLFDPTHFADPSAGRVIHRIAEPNRLEFLELKSIKQTASSEVRKYPLSTRKCIFQDENREDFHDMYSYSACIIRCRIKSVLSLCQCGPYFLPMGKDEGPICLLSDLQCLNKYKEKLSHLYPTQAASPEELELEESLHCHDCYPDCEHTRHVTKSYKTSMNMFTIDKYFAYGFAQSINLTNKCILSIYYATPGGDLERLDVVSYWYQIISNIGGFSGVLIGLSVFSLVEMVFFFLLRYSQEIYKNYNEFHH